jgi:hypothetical protein
MPAGRKRVPDLREDVAIVEAEAAIGDQREDDLLAVDAVLVAVLVGQGQCPRPRPARSTCREVLRDLGMVRAAGIEFSRDGASGRSAAAAAGRRPGSTSR